MMTCEKVPVERFIYYKLLRPVGSLHVAVACSKRLTALELQPASQPAGWYALYAYCPSQKCRHICSHFF